jgi:GDPmannose 4,6-dehydratase
LIAQGCEVHGLVRRSSSDALGRIRHLLPVLHLHSGDLTDLSSLLSLVGQLRPEQLYNLGAQSSVPQSFAQPLATLQITGLGAANVLEAVRLVSPETRVYQAGSSEMFGNALQSPQHENTPFSPASPYAVAKVQAQLMARHYRERGLFVVAGILFNHESPRRGEEFVTRKIAKAVARIQRGEQAVIPLGNLEARRDWGWAPDYVDAMVAMMAGSEPKDYVVATGQSWSVRQFAEQALALIGRSFEDCVRVDPALIRPADIAALVGDAGLARRELGWKPTVDFTGLVERMVRAEVDACAT